MGIKLTFLVLASIVFVGKPLRASNLKCVVEIYLASHTPQELLGAAVASVADFTVRQQIPTKRIEEPSRLDKIRARIDGIPAHLKVTYAKAGQPFLYFFVHRNVPRSYPVTDQLRKLILWQQKIVAGPGSYVNVDSGSGNYLRETYTSLTGVFLFSTTEKIDSKRLSDYGEPLWVELLEGTPLVELDNGATLIPGIADELTVPVMARSLSEAERSRITVEPIQVYGTSRRALSGLR